MNLDFSLIKNGRIHERVNAQFRLEFFNITNHAESCRDGRSG